MPRIAPSAKSPARGRCSPAFTIVELIVVVTVIVLILAVAVPGISAMNAEARLTTAYQTINGAMTQTYVLALANRTMTALRFLPAQWDANEPAAAGSGRQNLLIYNYVGNTVNEVSPGSGNFQIGLREYFERAKEYSPQQMPEDVWAAPLEALTAHGVTLAGTTYGGAGYSVSYNPFGPNFVLSGTIGQFRWDAERDAGGDGVDFLNADDFLIVCDPEQGLRTATPQAFRMRAHAPAVGYEADTDPISGYLWYRRYSFSGVVTYRREPLVALGNQATGQARQDLLREKGRPYLAQRFGGGLVPAKQRP